MKDWAEFVLKYPAENTHLYHEVRSGALWVWQVRRTTQIPLEWEVSFPGLQQIVAIERHQTHKRSGAVSQESDLYLTSLPGDQADAATLALISRGHWGITNGMWPWGRRLVAPAKRPKPWLPCVTSC